MTLPGDLKDIMDPGKDREPYSGPIYWLWAFDPMTASVHVTHNEDRHPAHAFTHKDLAPEVNHPSRLDGYAYKIRGGYRITSADHQEVSDPFIVKRVSDALAEDTGRRKSRN